MIFSKRILIAAVAMTLALGAAAEPAGASTVSASSGGLRATLRAGTHHPRINHRWPVQVTATWHGRAVHGAGAYYQFLYGGRDVSDQPVCGTGIAGCKNWGFKFNGRYSDTLVFPAQSRGVALTLRVVVSYGRVRVYVPYQVQPIQ